MPVFFTPGPAELYPTVSHHIVTAMEQNILSISHRSTTYQDFHGDVFTQLQTMTHLPDDWLMFFAGSATQLMERTVQNTVETHSFHHVNGSFSRRFFEISRDLGKQAAEVRTPLGSGFNGKNINIPPHTELITFTAVETSTGVQISNQTIAAARRNNPEAIIALDAVSTFPLFEVDFATIDVLIFGVQKALGLPAGLGIALVSPRAIAKAQQLKRRGVSTGSFGSWPLIAEKASNFQTLETPNVLGIYVLSKVLADMNRVGIATIQAESKQKLALIHTAIEQHPQLDWFVKNPDERAESVVVAECQQPAVMIEKMSKKGWILGGGYGENAFRQFRIANFPAIGIQQTRQMLTDLEKIRI